jgi:hypothetical protein
MYNVYKGVVMYTLAEFRKNLRQAFNDADQGHEVVIERYGQKFQLISLVDKPLPGHNYESVPKGPPVLLPQSDAWEGPLPRNKKKNKL